MAITGHRAMRVCIVTMGCAKNEVDSANMARRLQDAGHAMVRDAGDADVVIVNTCSFIQSATEESLQAVFDVLALPRMEEGSAKLVVAGCMPARYGNDLRESLTEAQAFVPCSAEDDIVDVVEGLAAGLPQGAGDPSRAYGVPCAEDAPSLSEPFAYVKISDGCDRFCAYCAIPYIRGRYHSFPEEQIEADAAARIAEGAREIVLIAQDTGRWGQDIGRPDGLAGLLAGLAQRHPDTWFRVMYVQPEGITDALLDAMATHDNICSYLDIPLQHAVPRILRSMNRAGGAKEFLALLAHVRQAVPGITLRTTLIAGYPGETDEDFQALCDFVQDAEFDYVGVFGYSREEGTKAAGLPGQVDEDEKADRARELRDVADAVSQAVVARRVGLQMDVLVLGVEDDGQVYGRAQCQAPEVDGVCYLPAGQAGQVVSARIIDTLFYEMEGE